MVKSNTKSQSHDVHGRLLPITRFGPGGDYIDDYDGPSELSDSKEFLVSLLCVIGSFSVIGMFVLIVRFLIDIGNSSGAA